jgi:PKD repeat protein
MYKQLRILAVAVLVASHLAVSACEDNTQSPSTRSEPAAPAGNDTLGGSMLRPLDLVYVCGNKFLVTNATPRPVQVEYRVAGTDEGGSLRLVEGPGQDPGFSETELETTERGVVELFLNNQRVARRPNDGARCGASAISASAAAAGSEETVGSWSAPFPWPVVALHLIMLPDGKVLSWGHGGTPQVWNPSNGTFTAVPSPVLLFCAGHTLLPDGRVLTAGGHITNDHGLPDITLFSAGSQSWSRSASMRRGRWYPTNTTLSNGDVVILAGKDEAGTVVAEPEVWSSGSVRLLSTASRVLPYYPRAFLAPNGKLFYAGQERTTRYLDPTGTGAWTTVGDRLYGIRDYGSAVMYDDGKILYAGGGRTTNMAEIIDLNAAAPVWQWTGSMAYPRRHLNTTVLPTGEVLVTGGSSGTGFNDVSLAVHAAELWNPSTGVWTTLSSNTINRTYHSTSILLPDGRILHTGSGDGNGAPDERNAELFSPPYLFKGPRPTITDAPSEIGYNTAFSVATPQAADIAKVSLIRLGSVTHAFDMNQRFQWLRFVQGTDGLTITAPTSRNETPPGHYMLFILDGNDVPSVAKIVKVGSESDPNPPPPPPPPPSSFALRVSTRSDVTTQYMTLEWTGASGSMVDVYRNGILIKTTENDGHYTNSRNFQGTATYVYKLCQAGSSTCSNTATAQFGGGTPPPNGAPTADFTSSCSDLSCTFADGSTDEDGSVAGWQWNFGDGSSSTVPSPSRTYAAGGTYTVTLTVTDNQGGTGSVSKQVTATAPGSNLPPSSNFRSSCSALTCNFTDQSIDSDGSVTAWSWTFGDGGTSTSRSPSRTYAGAGTYPVTLTVTDNAGATNQSSQSVTVTKPSISLTVVGRADATKQYMALDWTGAGGATVDVYRNGARIINTPNDGHYGNSRTFHGPATYVYKVCQAGTTTCSNEATVTFK